MSLLLFALALAGADRGAPAARPASPRGAVVVSSLTTPQLAEFCRGKDDDPAANFCTGYLMGVFDALSLAHEICPSPARASNLQVVTVARRYLRKRGRKSKAAPAFVVRDALRAAYPCRRR